MTTPDLLDETAARVVDILSGTLNTTADELVAQPLLGTYNWDSLTTLETLVALEAEFGIEIDLRALHAQRTAGDLVDLVRAAHDGS